MAKWNRSLCDHCRVVFVKESEDQRFCSFICHSHFHGVSANGLKRINCCNCDRLFNSSDNKLYCSNICSVQGRKNGIDKEQRMIERNKKCNENWINNKNPSAIARNNKNRIPLHILNKIEEHKRVWEDKGWKHYLDGKKYDKI